MRPAASKFKTLTAMSGVIAIFITIGLICVALLWGMMLYGHPSEIIIATWMALGLSKYFFNALLVVFAYSSLESNSASEHYVAFLVPSLLLMLWNLAALPHKLAYGYFAFWMFYSFFLVLNRNGSGQAPEEAGADTSTDTRDASA